MSDTRVDENSIDFRVGHDCGLFERLCRSHSYWSRHVAEMWILRESLYLIVRKAKLHKLAVKITCDSYVGAGHEGQMLICVFKSETGAIGLVSDPLFGGQV